LIGRPADSEAAAKLAPIASPPIAAALDKLPTAKLKLPPGFNIEVYAGGMALARSLAEGDKGTVFVGSRQSDKVHAIVNKDGKRSVKVLASGLQRPNGVAFKNGTLYIAELSKVSKVDKVEDNLGQREADDDLRRPAERRSPRLEVHRHRAGQTSSMFRSGSPATTSCIATRMARSGAFNLDGSGAEVIARGVRNTVGFDWNPETKTALLHRQRPRLDVRRRSRGRTQSRHQGRRTLWCAVLPAGQYRRSRIRLGQIPVPITRPRLACWARTRPRSVCGSTPAACSRRVIRTPSFIARRGFVEVQEKVGGDVVSSS